MKIRNLFSRRSVPAPPTPVTDPAPITQAPVAAPAFVLGESQNITLGVDTVWDTDAYPHLLIAGPPETGKTRIQRLIIEHCVQHKEHWRVYGMDLYQTQLTPYVEYGTPVEHIAQNVSDSILDLRLVQDEMRGRLLRMREHGYKSYRELTGKLPSIMVVIDESYHVLPTIMTPAERAVVKFDVRIESLNILKELTQYGSRAGVHISMATRVPAQGITDDLRKNLTGRVVTGAFPAESSQLMLATDDAVSLMPGQSYIQCGEQGKTFTILNPSG